MPPRDRSRFMFSTASMDDVGALVLTDYEPFRFVARSDNRQHIVQGGDTLWTLAAKYFAPVPRPAGLWWVIADFQPAPILDPTLKLQEGTVLTIPSLRTLQEDVFSDKRRAL